MVKIYEERFVPYNELYLPMNHLTAPEEMEVFLDQIYKLSQLEEISSKLEKKSFKKQTKSRRFDIEEKSSKSLAEIRKLIGSRQDYSFIFNPSPQTKQEVKLTPDQNAKQPPLKDEEKMPLKNQAKIGYYEIGPDGLSQEAKDKIDEVLKLLQGETETWMKRTDGDGLKIFTKNIDGIPVLSTRAEMKIEGVPPKSLIKLLTDLEMKGKLEENFKGFKIFEKLSSKVYHLYQYVKTPLGMTNRDFCLKRIHVENYKGIQQVLIDFSVEHEDYPETSKFIRAEARCMAALVYDLEGGGSLLKCFNQVNMKVLRF